MFYPHTNDQADFRQPDFQKAFFGKNYGRLRAIKARYDPDDVFYALTAVGSDEWEVGEDGRLCRVAGPRWGALTLLQEWYGKRAY